MAKAMGQVALDRTLRLAVICGVLALAGCAERETYLPGKRESVDAALSDAPLADDTFANRSAPVSLICWLHGVTPASDWRANHAAQSSVRNSWKSSQRRSDAGSSGSMRARA